MTRICIQQTHSTHNSLGTYLKIKDPSKTGTYIIIYIKIYTRTFLPNSSIFEKSGHTLKLLIWQKKSSEIAPLICPRMNSLLPGPFCLLKLKKICAKWRKLTFVHGKIMVKGWRRCKDTQKIRGCRVMQASFHFLWCFVWHLCHLCLYKKETCGNLGHVS